MSRPKWLIELKKTEWEAYKEKNPPKGQAQFYYKDNTEYWSDGFCAAFDLLYPVMKQMADALEKVNDCGVCKSRKVSWTGVEQSLADYRELEGE